MVALGGQNETSYEHANNSKLESNFSQSVRVTSRVMLKVHRNHEMPSFLFLHSSLHLVSSVWRNWPAMKKCNLQSSNHQPAEYRIRMTWLLGSIYREKVWFTRSQLSSKNLCFKVSRWVWSSAEFGNHGSRTNPSIYSKETEQRQWSILWSMRAHVMS